MKSTVSSVDLSKIVCSLRKIVTTIDLACFSFCREMAGFQRLRCARSSLPKSIMPTWIPILDRFSGVRGFTERAYFCQLGGLSLILCNQKKPLRQNTKKCVFIYKLYTAQGRLRPTTSEFLGALCFPYLAEKAFVVTFLLLGDAGYSCADVISDAWTLWWASDIAWMQVSFFSISTFSTVGLKKSLLTAWTDQLSLRLDWKLLTAWLSREAL